MGALTVHSCSKQWTIGIGLEEFLSFWNCRCKRNQHWWHWLKDMWENVLLSLWDSLQPIKWFICFENFHCQRSWRYTFYDYYNNCLSKRLFAENVLKKSVPSSEEMWKLFVSINLYCEGFWDAWNTSLNKLNYLMRPNERELRIRGFRINNLSVHMHVFPWSISRAERED